MKQLITISLFVTLLFTLTACSHPVTHEVAASPSVVQTESVVPGESSPEAPGDTAETDAPKDSAETEAPSALSNTDGQETSILIAYFSWSGNTELVANEIQSQTGGDLFEIVPEEPYPNDYEATGERWREEQAADARPAIAGTVAHMADYDTIFLGYPIWSSTLPSVNRTFLEQYDLSGKTIIPFCTHGGSRFGSSVGVIEELAPDAVVADGFEISGSRSGNCSEGVTDWLRELGMVQ